MICFGYGSDLSNFESGSDLLNCGSGSDLVRYLLIQEEKDKILNIIGALIFNLPVQDFVPEEISVVDPKLLLLDPDPANNFGSDWIRIHNTGRNPVKLTITSSTYQ